MIHEKQKPSMVVSCEAVVTNIQNSPHFDVIIPFKLQYEKKTKTMQKYEIGLGSST